MMGFLSAMNFPRWVIVVMLLSSAYLGYTVYNRTERLKEVELELEQVPGLARRIQTLAMKLDGLQDRADKESLKGEAKLEYYIRTIAHSDVTRMGEVDITPQKPKSQKGFEDHTYTIKPYNKNQNFSRTQIGNFLYKLEADSRKVKVTKIDLKPCDTTKMGEIGDDNWTFLVGLTSRQASGG